jgi:hypothetical protein
MTLDPLSHLKPSLRRQHSLSVTELSVGCFSESENSLRVVARGLSHKAIITSASYPRTRPRLGKSLSIHVPVLEQPVLGASD